MMKKLVLFSGGMDSTAVLLMHKENSTALFFDYGQRHISELDAARKITDMLGIPLKVFKTDILTTIGGSSLTDDNLIVKPHDASFVNDTFVPGRNILFITIASCIAYVDGFGEILTGIRESETFPDCRRSSMNSLRNTINLGVNQGVKIRHPIFDWDREQVTKYLVESKDILKETKSCYNGNDCGYCKPCVERNEIFSRYNI